MSEQTSADRVRAAIAQHKAPSRQDMERALRDQLGLSVRQARAFCARGISALGEAPAEEAIDEKSIAELGERLAQIANRIRTG